MRHVLVVLLVLSATARAQTHFGELIEGELAPDVSLFEGPPPELARTIAPAHAAARLAMFERALHATTHPLARANLELARADLLAALGLANQLSTALELRIIGGEQLARATTIYAGLVCDPRDRAGFTCGRAARLAGWRGLPGALDRFAYVLAFGRHLTDDAQVVYRRVVTDHPRSPYATRAYLAIGDHALDRGKPARALEAYATVLRAPRLAPPLRAYTLFRRGLAELALDRGRAAFATFAATLARAPAPILASAVRDELARAYATFGAPATAYAALARVAPDHALALADAVALRWQEHRRSGDARALTGELLRRAPGDPRTCAWQARLAELASDLGDRAGMLAATERLVEVLGRARAVLADDALAACTRATRELTLGHARHLVATGFAFPDDDVLADRLYALFVRAFPDAPERAAVQRERARLRDVR